MIWYIVVATAAFGAGYWCALHSVATAQREAIDAMRAARRLASEACAAHDSAQTLAMEARMHILRRLT